MSKWHVLLALIGLWLAGCARDDKFPSQPVTLICPWAAGGGTDRVSRQVASQLERELGVPVNVVNATGGAGVTGHTRGARSLADGYTVTMITVELNMLHWRGLTNITHADFIPLMMLNRDNAALFVRGDSTIKSLGELEQAIRSQPGKLKASGTAQGGIWHVAVAGWLDNCGMESGSVNWISINGAGPSLQELIADGVQFVCCALPEADAMLSAGQVRCLGVMADARLAQFPNAATFTEQGRAWSMAGWRGVAVPKGTPADRVAILARACERVSASSEFSKFMSTSGFDITIEPGDKFARTLAVQDAMFRDILNSSAFRSVSSEHFGLMLFPGAIAGLLALVIGGVAWSDRRTTRAAGTFRIRSRAGLNVLAVLAAIVFFVAGVQHLGFVFTCALILFVLLVLFRVHAGMSLAISVLTSLMIYQAFAVMLRVSLPRAWLEW